MSLRDGIVILRVPSGGDGEAVQHYLDEESRLDGCWLPLVPGATARRSVADWLDGWAGRSSHNGPTLMVTVPDECRFVGAVGFRDRDAEIVELTYGIAPDWRARSASRSAQLATAWALSLAAVSAVELRIGAEASASQHVAANAGFTLNGTVTQFVPRTGETFEDLRYLRRRGDSYRLKDCGQEMIIRDPN